MTRPPHIPDEPRPASVQAGSVFRPALYTIRFLGPADGSSHPLSGRYLIAYDPDFHLPDGRYDGGTVDSTDDIAQAGRFEFPAAVLILKASPKCRCHALRADGKPNRPLTAFNAVVETAKE